MFGLSTLATRIIGALILVAVVLGLMTVRSCQLDRQRAAEAKIEKGQSGAAINAGVEAQNTMVNRAEENAKIDAAVKEGTDDIRQTSTPIAPASRDTALRAACRMHSYKHHERCAAVRAADTAQDGAGR